MKNSIDEQIEKLEKDLLGTEKNIDSTENTTESNEQSANSSNDSNTLFMGIGVLIPVLVGGGLYYAKPNFITHVHKKKKQINMQRLVFVTAGATIVSWLVLYGISKK